MPSTTWTKTVKDDYTLTDIELWSDQGVRKNCDVFVEAGKVKHIAQTGSMQAAGMSLLLECFYCKCDGFTATNTQGRDTFLFF